MIILIIFYCTFGIPTSVGIWYNLIQYNKIVNNYVLMNNGKKEKMKKKKKKTFRGTTSNEWSIKNKNKGEVRKKVN